MKLPEIYKNKIDEDLDNNTRTFISSTDNDNIDLILKDLPTLVYITTKDKNFYATVIGKTTNYIVTRDKEVIRISDIIKIKKI